MKNKSTPENNLDRDSRYFDLFSALVLLFALITASLRLSSTQWAENLEVTQAIVFWGALAGLAVGQSIYSPRAAFLFCLNYGVFVVPWQLGAQLFSYGVEWPERLLSMWGRISVVLGDLSRREPVTDNMLFLTLMSILFWALSSYAGYILVRRAGIWRAVLPTGAAAMVIQSFDPLLPRRAWFLATYLFLSLLLVGRMTFLVNTHRWKQQKTHIPPDVSYDLTRITLAVVAILVLLAWNTPALAHDFPLFSSLYRSQVEPARQRLADRMSYMFSSLQASVGLVSDFYGEEMILGAGSLHTDRTALMVEAPEFVFPGQRYYWRARVYDEYSDGKWSTTTSARQEYAAGINLPIPDLEERDQAVFKFRPQLAIATLYGASQPLSFSRAGEMQMRRNPDGTLDLVAMEGDPYIRPGEVYEVTASLPSFTENELREAGTNYPDWVIERYLQLPPEITPRTLELARRLALGKDNPYDIAKGITEFLRENIEYVETLDELPAEGEEPVDWFLFEYQKGFCNYYATSQVVLLRSLGIPARWAVGYAQGERTEVTDNAFSPRDPENMPDPFTNIAVYTARQRDAHAWPEVYFPGLGWVEFEPTASQAAIVRVSGDEVTPDPLDPEENPANPAGNLPPSNEPDPFEDLTDPDMGQNPAVSPLSIALALLGTGLALGLLGLALFARQRRLRAWVSFERLIRGEATPLPVRLEQSLRRFGLRPPAFLQRWARIALLPTLSKAYLEIDRALQRLGVVPEPWFTPAERAMALKQVLPQAAVPVDQLLVEYQLATYSPYTANDAEARLASQAIRRLSWLALLQKLLARFQEEPRRR